MTDEEKNAIIVGEINKATGHEKLAQAMGSFPGRRISPICEVCAIRTVLDVVERIGEGMVLWRCPACDGYGYIYQKDGKSTRLGLPFILDTFEEDVP